MILTIPDKTAIFVRAYLRASTSEQDALRARGSLDAFARARGLVICNYYTENESGARLNRPELFRLLNDCQPRDILLVEDVDRLSRLKERDWQKLKTMLREREVKVVAVNVPTTWQHLSPAQGEFDGRMFGAINDMLLDMLAAIARRDYEQRRERQKQGIATARAAGKYKGRKIDQIRYDAITRMLASGNSWASVQRTLECSRTTISRAVHQMRQRTTTIVLPALPRVPTVPVRLWARIENNSKFVRGRKRVQEDIEFMVQRQFAGRKLSDCEYSLIITYENETELKEQLDELFTEVHQLADLRNCFAEDVSIKHEITGLYWREFDGGWWE